MPIAFTAQPKIQSQSQIFRYGRSIFCLPHQPNFSDIFDLCLHWLSVVRGLMDRGRGPTLFMKPPHMCPSVELLLQTINCFYIWQFFAWLGLIRHAPINFEIIFSNSIWLQALARTRFLYPGKSWYNKHLSYGYGKRFQRVRIWNPLFVLFPA